MIIHFARYTVRVSVLLIGLILILLALFTLSARVALPVAAQYKNGIETRVSDYLGNPVDFGQLSFKWEGFGPILMASDVSVFESDERKVTLDQLLIDVNLAKSLLRGSPVINELSLVGANLAIEADSGGQVRLHGMEPTGSSHAVVNDSTNSNVNGPGVDLVGWLFNAQKVGLLDSTVSLIDRGADRTLVVEDLTILAENDDDFHQLRVDMKLPAELGGKLEAGIDLTGNARNLAASTGDIYLSGENLNLQALVDLVRYSGWRTGQTMSPTDLDADVSIELWGQWREGQMISMRGPINSSDIVDTLNDKTVLDQFNTNMVFESDAVTNQLTLIDSFARLNDESLIIDKIGASWNHSDKDVWSVQAKGQTLPLQLGLRLPVALLKQPHPDFARRLMASSPEGLLSNWSVEVEQQGDAPSINAAMSVESLRLLPHDNFPGVGPIDAQLALVESKGSVDFSAEQLQVHWNMLGEQSRTMDQLEGSVDIDLTNLQRLVSDANFSMQDDGIDVQTRAKATLVPGASPLVDLQTRYKAVDVVAFKQWLPRAVLPTGTQRWIDRAIQGGRADNGSLLFFGHMADFPFDQGQGVLRSSVDISNGQLAFLPNWPTATGINGTMELDGLTVTGTAETSRLDAFDISSTRLRIANVLSPILEIQGTGSGELQQMIEFGRTGPLSAFLEPALSDISADGMAQMDIDVTVPLYREPENKTPRVEEAEAAVEQAATARLVTWEPFKVTGSVFVANNRIRMGKADMVFEASSGAIGFDLDGIRINNMRATMLGHRVLIDAKTTGKGTNAITEISLQGALEANDILAHYNNTLDQFLGGASNWNVRLSVPHSAKEIEQNGVELRASSNLEGTELRLPKPFYKSTRLAMPFELVTAFREPDQIQRWDIRYGSSFQARAITSGGTLQSLLIDLDETEYAGVEIEDPPPGIRVQGRLDSLVVDGWVQSFARYIESLPGSENGPQKFLPVSASLDVDDLIVGTQSLGVARLQSNSDDTFLNLLVSNESLTGNLRYPRRYWERDTALKARISHIDWSLIDALASIPTESSQGSDGDDLDPRLLPSMEARIASITRESVELRDVVLRAEPDVSGLNITTLGFAYQTMRLIGRGSWHLRDPQSVNPGLTGKHITNLNLVLQSDDFGAGLEQIGLNDIILDGEGSIALDLSWAGPAYKPAIDKLVGTASALMENGSVIPFEPGAGRVVGLFALQALPRRLNLDFKDITSGGLAFKRITGDIEIEKGIADVKLVQLTGPIGVVDITGPTNLKSREFDQRVTVLPRVSAALPIIGAISGGASAGIGALVAAGFLKVLGIDFDRIGLRNYNLTGTWQQPVLKPLGDAG